VLRPVKVGGTLTLGGRQAISLDAGIDALPE
jgi:hypothetical protein